MPTTTRKKPVKKSPPKRRAKSEKQALANSTRASAASLACRLDSRGRLHIFSTEPTVPANEVESHTRIARAFKSGVAAGTLHLGLIEVHTELSPELGFFRDVGKLFVASACSINSSLTPEIIAAPRVKPQALAQLAERAPLSLGIGNMDVEFLSALWNDMKMVLVDDVETSGKSVVDYLTEANEYWNVAGRVCLHLAENKRDKEYPFAFIATYARLERDQSEPRYVPLSRALDEYASAGQRQELMNLLRPLQRAANESPLIEEMLRSNDIYHALAWTAEQAHAFLLQVETCERAGLRTRLPNWWSSHRTARPRVSVAIGSDVPSNLGMGALLDIDIQVTLGGDPLSDEEVRSLLAASASLTMLKGRWVEVDPEKLSEVLDQWQEISAQAEGGKIRLGQASRLLAGAAEGDESDSPQAWSDVVAGAWLSKNLKALREPKLAASLEKKAKLHATLRPYQNKGLHWLWTLWQLGLGGCLADDMGLGKTIQVIALLSLLKRGRRKGIDLLIVPASLLENWRRELASFAPHLSAMIAHPSAMPQRKLKALSPADLKGNDVVITTYGMARRLGWIAETSWRVICLDEAQAIKNPNTKHTQAIKALSSQWRLALTGTPVENSLGDLWSIIDFINPGLLGSATEFAKLSRAMSKQATGYAPLRKLLSPYILRRLKTDPAIAADLPAKTELQTYCLLTKVQAALYEQGVEELALKIRELQGIERRGLILAFLTRFKQICNHPAQWLGTGDFAHKLSGKFQRLAELCESIKARREKALIFTQYRSMTEPLRAHLESCFGHPGLVLHGGTPVKARQQLVQEFQEDGSIPFMVLSLKAGGTGLNLTAANHVIHFDRWWNPATENQATDRAFRIGQTKGVLVHKFVCRGTIEERIDELVSSKQELSEKVIDGSGALKLTELSDRELLSMVELDIRSALSG